MQSWQELAVKIARDKHYVDASVSDSGVTLQHGETRRSFVFDIGREPTEQEVEAQVHRSVREIWFELGAKWQKVVGAV